MFLSQEICAAKDSNFWKPAALLASGAMFLAEHFKTHFAGLAILWMVAAGGSVALAVEGVSGLVTHPEADPAFFLLMIGMAAVHNATALVLHLLVKSVERKSPPPLPGKRRFSASLKIAWLAGVITTSVAFLVLP